MNLVLIALGVLGFGAIAVAAYVFTVAARNYVSNDHLTTHKTSNPSNAGDDLPRNTEERRSDQSVKFPLTVNDITVVKDRRQKPERRKELNNSSGQ